MIVLDASIFLSLLLQEENNVLSGNAFEQLLTEQVELVVPPIFKVEVLNALLMARKRERISIETLRECVQLLEGAPLRTDDTIRYSDLIDIALDCQLTSYDASYVALASKHFVPLLTLDKAMMRAARTMKLPEIICN